MISLLLISLLLIPPIFSKNCDGKSTTAVPACNTCDMNKTVADKGGEKIVPFQIEGRPDVDGCPSTYIRCLNPDVVLCESVTIYADSDNGTVRIGESELTFGDVVVTCGYDGKYFWEGVKGIESIYCIFVNCIP